MTNFIIVVKQIRSVSKLLSYSKSPKDRKHHPSPLSQKSFEPAKKEIEYSS